MQISGVPVGEPARAIVEVPAARRVPDQARPHPARRRERARARVGDRDRAGPSGALDAEERQRWRRRWDCCIPGRWAPWWARACARAAPASSGPRRAAARRARRRARAAGLEDLGALAAVVAASDVILSVCPPGSATDVARLVAAARFGGLYVDANAVAPATARARRGDRRRGGRRASSTAASSARRPARPATTRLYLAGPRAGEVAEPVQGERARGHRDAGRRRHGLGPQDGLRRVDEGLERPPPRRAGAGHPRGRGRRRSAPSGSARSPVSAPARRRPSPPTRGRPGASSARWRRSRATFAAAGLPAGFHEACAPVYDRLGRYKDAAAAPPIAEVADALGGQGADPPRSRAAGRRSRPGRAG